MKILIESKRGTVSRSIWDFSNARHCSDDGSRFTVELNEHGLMVRAFLNGVIINEPLALFTVEEPRLGRRLMRDWFDKQVTHQSLSGGG